MPEADAPPALPAALERMPGHMIRRLHQLSVAIFAREMAAAGIDLTPIQYATLETVAERSGLDQATLAASVALDRVTVGGVVDRLVAKGLVARAVSRRDRRARELHLTAEGGRLLAAVRGTVQRVQEMILAGLPPGERERFLDLLDRALGEDAGARAAAAEAAAADAAAASPGGEGR